MQQLVQGALPSNAKLFADAARDVDGYEYFEWQAREAKIKMARGYIGGATSAVFTLNAVIGLGVASKQLERARFADYKGDEKTKSIALSAASISVISNSLNILVNGAKSINSFSNAVPQTWLTKHGISAPGRTKWGKAWGITGTGLGVVQATASIAALTPYLFSDSLSKGDKVAVGFEMGQQAIGGGLMIASTILMQRYAVQNLTRTATGSLTAASRLKLAAGPAAAIAAAVTLSFSSIELANIAKEYQYANELDKLGIEGGTANAQLAGLYRKKANTELGIALGTAAATIVGAIVVIASSMAAGPAGIALGADLIAGTFTLVMRSIQQKMLENIADDYAAGIRSDLLFYENNLLAQFKRLFDSEANPGNKEYLQNLQDFAGVDSVIAFASPQQTAQALELAGITRTQDVMQSALAPALAANWY